MVWGICGSHSSGFPLWPEEGGETGLSCGLSLSGFEEAEGAFVLAVGLRLVGLYIFVQEGWKRSSDSFSNIALWARRPWRVLLRA